MAKKSKITEEKPTYFTMKKGAQGRWYVPSGAISTLNTQKDTLQIAIFQDCGVLVIGETIDIIKDAVKK